MTWFRILGITLIIAGCGTYGLMGAHRFEHRVEQLKQMRLALAFLEKEITYLQMPLSRALSRTANFTPLPVKQLFLDSANSLQDRQGVTLQEVWQKGLEGLRKNGDLNREDLALLQNLSGQLGMSGIEEQKKLFQLMDEQLQIQEIKAREETKSNKKIWSYGGFIIGITVVLLMI